MNLSKFVKNGVYLSVLLTPSISLAGPLTITNTFSSGSPAVAAEVNENFSDVGTAVNDNDGRITTNSNDISQNAVNIGSNTSGITTNEGNISSNTSRITANEGGIAVNADDISQNTANIGSNASRITTNEIDIANNANAISSLMIPVFRDSLNNIFGVFLMTFSPSTSIFNGMSNTGHVFAMGSGFNLVTAALRYSLVDCVGQAYIESSFISIRISGALAGRQGFVFLNSDEVYYLPKDTSGVLIASLSRKAAGVCSNVSSTGLSVVPVLPNDSAITGVADSVATETFTLGL